jgi:hypothetical protein
MPNIPSPLCILASRSTALFPLTLSPQRLAFGESLSKGIAFQEPYIREV